jgi:hypothetical protein
MKKNLTAILLALFVASGYAQGVGIGIAPDPSAMLDVSSTSRGLLTPRVALTGSTDATTITNGNVTSLLVYNIATVADVIPGYYYWNGSAWINLENTDNQGLSYNSATNVLSLTNGGTPITLSGLIGHDWYEVGISVPANDINDNIYTQGNVGIASTNPVTKLQIGNSPGGTYRAWMDYGLIIGDDTDGIFVGVKDEGPDQDDAIIAWGDNSQDDLRFLYNQSGLLTSTEIMTLQPDGDIGIGEVNPTNKLTIGANLGTGYGISLNSTTPYGQLIQTTEATATSNAAFWVRTNNGTTVDPLFRVQNNGNVGVGTNTPTSKLEVNGDLKINNTSGHILLEDTDQTIGEMTRIERDGGGLIVELVSTNSALLKILDNGNVGVGTNTPTSKLEVNGQIIQGPNNTWGQQTRIGIDAPLATVPEATIGSTNGNLHLEARTGFDTYINHYSAGGNLYMATGNNTGNVGIGTISATSKLTVNGVLEINKIADVSTIYFTNSASEPGYIRHSGNSNAAEMRFVASDDFDVGSPGDKFTFGGETGGVFTEAMRIQGNGNVGIKTTAPSQRLHVIGNILASGTITSSDERYKEGIQNLKNSTDILSSIRPVAYNFRTEEFPEGQFDDKLHYGIIAQELETVLPNLVYTDLEGYKGINYTELIPLLIKSNQEQQALIETQQKQINQLINAVEALKK